MVRTMQHNSISGMVLAVLSWLSMKFFLMINFLTMADISSMFVIIGVIWTFVANADKAIKNIQRFIKWLNK